jgi:hypothetical protein
MSCQNVIPNKNQEAVLVVLQSFQAYWQEQRCACK